MNKETETLKRYPHLPGLAPETMKLIELLRHGTPGDMFTDEELKEVCGKDTAPPKSRQLAKNSGYTNLQTSIKRCEKDYGIVWRREFGAGVIRCLDDTGKYEVVACNRKIIHRRAKRSVRIADTVNIAALPEEIKHVAAAERATMMTMVGMSNGGILKKLTARHITDKADMQKLLEAYTKR